MPDIEARSQHQIPYPGTAPFQDRREDRLAFFGREQEIQDLMALLLSESQVLLLARSGLGKTSLINAGLLERLRERNFFPVTARIVEDSAGGPTATIIERIADEAKTRKVEISRNPHAESLWTYFDQVTFLRGGGSSATPTLLKPILVLDQFEELFTLLPNDKRERFVSELADLVYGRAPRHVRDVALKALDSIPEDSPARSRLVDVAYGRPVFEVKVMFSIREDFLAELEGIKNIIPDIFRHTYRLGPLTTVKARDAIMKPAQQKELLGDNTVDFEPAAVDAMISFLCRQQAGGTMLAGGDIEPVQLQILCRSLLERALKSKRNQITRSDLGGEKGMERIIRQYYIHVLKKLPTMRVGWNPRKYRLSVSNLGFLNLPRYAAQQLCESGLILPNGVRNSLEGGYISANFGVPEGDLIELVQQRLLRRETRSRGMFYELSHDSLTNVLLSARAERRAIFVVLVAVLIFLVGVGIRPTIDNFQALLASYKIDPLRVQIADRTKSDDLRRDAFGQLERLSDTQVNLSDLVIDQLNLDKYFFRKSVTFTSSRLVGVSLRETEWMKEAQKSPGFAPRHALDFRYARITNTKFDQSDFTGATFDFALITGASFQSAVLSYSSFVAATISEANYSAAHLTATNFFRAKIDQTTFGGADLSYALFSNAKLDNVKFSTAKLDNTLFDNATIGENTDFSNAEWWLAAGWSRDRVASLEAKFPHADYAKTPTYLKGLNDHQRAVDAARSSQDAGTLASALNEIAWYRAIHGVDLAVAASEAEEAVRLTATNENILGNILDTEAYILMLLARQEEQSQQRERLEQARTIYVRALALPYSQLGYDYKVRGWRYRYALTLDYLGQSNEAVKYYKLSEGALYRPTHELLFMPRPEHVASQP